MIEPEPITIDGRKGVVVFLDADGIPVEPSSDEAVVARAVFDDGGRATYHVQPKRTDLGGAGSGNFGHGGRPGEVGGSSGEGGGEGGKAGQATEAPAGREPNPAPASSEREVPTPEKPLGTERPTPIVAKDLNHAVDLILKGEVVELKDVGTVHTVLSKLAEMAKDAEAKQEKAPSYDLCKVSVAGTNLFCGSIVKTAEFPDGIPRVKMPQFTGKAIEGTPAADLPKNKNGNVNAIPAFLKDLAAKDIGVKEERVAASSLKCTQKELVGATVASMMTSKTYDPGEEPIFVSSDGYVIDGHHRWAAVVGRDAKDGTLGESNMNIRRVDAPISELLLRAKTFVEGYGVDVKAGASALRMIFDEQTILLSYRDKLTKLSQQWEDEEPHV